MNLARTVLRRTFGRPQGLLGRLGGRLMARMNRACVASVLDLLDIGAGDRVLEIGFGPGVGVALAAPVAAFVAGLDLSPDILAQAKARNAAAIDQGRVDLRLGTAEQVPFESEAFDKVLAINSMHLWPDRAAALREIRRVLKRGGKLAFAFTPNSGQGKAGLLEILASAEFVDARMVDLQEGFCVLAAKP